MFSHNKCVLGIILLLWLFNTTSNITAEELSASDSARSSATNKIQESQELSVFPYVTIPEVDLRDVPVQEGIAALCRPYNVNVWISPEVTGTIRVYLKDVVLEDAFRLLVKENGLRWVIEDNIVKIYPLEVAARFETQITYQDGALTLDFRDVPLKIGIDAVIEATRRNIIIMQGATGTLTGVLKEISYEKGLEALLAPMDLSSNSTMT